MGSCLPPIPDDPYLECILKVIMKGTFDEVIAHLIKICPVNTNYSWVIKESSRMACPISSDATQSTLCNACFYFLFPGFGEESRVEPKP